MLGMVVRAYNPASTQKAKVGGVSLRSSIYTGIHAMSTRRALDSHLSAAQW